MYFYLKIGKRVFTFGNDRKGRDRRGEELPVTEEHREGEDRRKEDDSCGETPEAEAEED